MAIQISSGVTKDAIEKALENDDGNIVLGDEDAGVIIHNSSGETLEGEEVDKEKWVEIYGYEIHYSDTK